MSGATDPSRPVRPATEQPNRRLTEQERVVRAFLRDGRLLSIPAKPGKRDLLLPVIEAGIYRRARPMAPGMPDA